MEPGEIWKSDNKSIGFFISGLTDVSLHGLTDAGAVCTWLTLTIYSIVDFILTVLQKKRSTHASLMWIQNKQ